MLGLYKRQKELLSKSLDIKKRQLEEIQTKQKVRRFDLWIFVWWTQFFGRLKEIEDIARRMQVDRSQIENLVRLLFEHRNESTTSVSSYLDVLMNESEIKKKIMLISLNLASDPRVSHIMQRQRREFYEKTKKKV